MSDKKKVGQKKPKSVPVTQTQDDIVYGHIFDAILEQRLPPNTKLNEEALGGIFSVSRTIIRRALLRLSVEQVVDIRPNRGAIVAAPSVEEAKQVLKAREVLELSITELAVENATAEKIKELRELVAEENEAHAQGDVGRGIRISGEFHIQLAHMANNAPLLSFQRSIVSQTSLIISLYETGNQSQGQCSLDEHTTLLDAIEGGDKKRAMSLMQTHLDHIKSKLSLDDKVIKEDLHLVFSDVIKKKLKV